MNKPELKDFRLKEIKVHNKGGAFVDYSYLFSANGADHSDSIKFDRTLNISKDLVDLFKSMKPFVLRWADYNYRLIPIQAEKMGIDNLKELSQIIEGLQMDNLSKLEVTGIKIGGGADEKRTIVITYKKATQDKKIIGGATTALKTSGNVYGFEQELDEIIDALIVEVYKYVFDNKHSDSDQMALFPDLQEKVENNEESEPEKSDEPAKAEPKSDQPPKASKPKTQKK